MTDVLPDIFVLAMARMLIWTSLLLILGARACDASSFEHFGFWESEAGLFLTKLAKKSHNVDGQQNVVEFFNYCRRLFSVYCRRLFSVTLQK